MHFSMIFEKPDLTLTKDLIGLFSRTFAASEGPNEGQVIGKLVSDFLDDWRTGDLSIVAGFDGNALCASAIFSRFKSADRADAWLMAPVAVAPERQGNGFGTSIIAHGLEALAKTGADTVITYGDVNFYGRCGFLQVSEDIIPAPLPLSYPEGWLAQSLRGGDIAPMSGPTRCAAAISNPVYW